MWETVCISFLTVFSDAKCFHGTIYCQRKKERLFLSFPSTHNKKREFLRQIAGVTVTTLEVTAPSSLLFQKEWKRRKSKRQKKERGWNMRLLWRQLHTVVVAILRSACIM